jgi:hypothetical protein
VEIAGQLQRKSIQRIGTVQRDHANVFVAFVNYGFELHLRPMRTGLAGSMAFAAKYGSADLWMKRNMIVLTAMIANNVKALGRVFAVYSRLFRSAFRTTLRRHHIALVKHLLLFFREQKDLLTLHTRDLGIRHRCFLL